MQIKSVPTPAVIIVTYIPSIDEYVEYVHPRSNGALNAPKAVRRLSNMINSRKPDTLLCYQRKLRRLTFYTVSHTRCSPAMRFVTIDNVVFV